MQGTGGSTTVPDSYDKLRHAGAVARETLKLAASQQSGVPVTDLKTANGAVQLPDGSEIKYTELAAEASKLEPVQEVTLRDPSQWRLLGKPMKRLDIVAKSTGTQTYGIDIAAEGMVYAAVKTNPRQGGVLNSYDASAAKSKRGVSQIVDITNGVAVIADNTWRAFQAVNEIEFDWGEAPYPAEQDEHWQAVNASFTPDNLDMEWRDEGDVATVITVINVTEEKVEIWTGHQFPRQLQVLVADITGHSQDQIILHNQYMGGSFGHRLEFEHIKQAAEIANQMRGTPVKLTFTREEDFAHDFPRHISIGRGRGKVADGKVVALDFELAAPSVMTSQMGRAKIPMVGPDPQISAGSWNNPYKFENFRMRAYRAPELAPTSSWRSVGAAGAGFGFDCMLDELIHAAGADPLEERIRLINHDVSRKVLEAVGDMSSWGSKLPQGKGRGIAFVESFGVPTAEVVEVTNTDDGIKIDKVWIACDVGKVLDPINFENLVQGGVIFGLGHAMNCEITYSNGMAEQENYDINEPTTIAQKAPLTPSNVMPLAAIKKVKAGASNCAELLNAPDSEPTNAGIKASPATDVIKAAGARLAIVVTIPAANAKQV